MSSTEQIQALIAQHGGLASAEPVDPLIDEAITTPDGARVTTGRQMPNKTPRYRYILADGTSFVARSEWDGSFTITDPGTAMRQTSTKASPSPVGELEQVTDPRTGRPIKLRDPRTGALIDLPDQPAGKSTIVSTRPTEQYLVTQRPDGTLERVPNPGYDPAAAARAAADEEWQRTQQRLNAAYQQGRLSLDQAKAMAEQEHDRIMADLRRMEIEGNLAHQRAVEKLQAEGHATTRRGQDLGFASDLANNATSAAASALPYLVPKGWHGEFNKALQGIASGKPVEYGAPMTAPFPYDPLSVGRKVVADILGVDPSKVLGSTAPQPSTEGQGQPAGALAFDPQSGQWKYRAGQGQG